jgi:hypothetical protein
MPGWWLNRSPTVYAESPTIDPTDRSTLRVTMTSVSPTPSIAISEAPVSSCWTLSLLAKLWLCKVVTAKTSRTTMPIPTSRARSSALPRANRGAVMPGAVMEVMRPRPAPVRWRRA